MRFERLESVGLRILLEGYAAAVVGQGCDPAMTDRMEGLVDRMRSAVRTAILGLQSMFGSD